MYYIVKVSIQMLDNKWLHDQHYYAQYSNAYESMSKIADKLFWRMQRKEVITYHVEIGCYTS